jgi:hypothetical protein
MKDDKSCCKKEMSDCKDGHCKKEDKTCCKKEAGDCKDGHCKKEEMKPENKAETKPAPAKKP